MNFCLSHSDPNPAFQPIAKVHVLYVYIIFNTCLRVIPQVQQFILVWTNSCIYSDELMSWKLECSCWSIQKEIIELVHLCAIKLTLIIRLYY